MALIPIQCQNCGARYKLPETFKSDTARCKACGTVIDVKAQKEAGSSAARTRSKAGGTRAHSRRRQAGADAEVAHPKRSAHRRGAGRRRKHEEDDDEAPEQGRRARRERPKSNMPLIIGGVIGVMAILAVVLVVQMGDTLAQSVDDAKKQQDEMSKGLSAEASDAEKARLEAEEKKRKEAAAKEASAKKPEKPKKKPKEPPKKTPAKIEKLEDVFDPKTLKALPMPESISEDTLKDIKQKIAAISEGGLPGIQAKNALAEMGWEILVPLTNRLLELDFKSVEGNQLAFELDRLIFRITQWETAFDTMHRGEAADPQKAHANALCVRDLHTLGRKYWHSKEGFEKFQKVINKDKK